jgi:hypothetical protein
VCGTLAASPDARFCNRHEALASKWGKQRVLSGDYPGNAPKKRAVMKAHQEPSDWSPTGQVER